MVDFKLSFTRARRPAGWNSIVACLVSVFCAAFVVNAQESKPTGLPTKPVAVPAKPNGVPQTARSEGSPTVTAGVEEVPTPPINPEHPLYLPLQEAYKAREAIKDVKDYEAEFTKRELIGRALKKTTMSLKIRREPFSVYLKFLDANKGREVIYVEGRNKNLLQVHETGFRAIVGTLSLSPTSTDAMTDNRYPVTAIGLHSLLDKVIKQWEAEGKFGEVKTQKYPEAKLPSGEECIAYESLHPVQKNQFKFHITRLWIHKETGVAIRVEQLGFPQRAGETPQIIEEYTYSKLKTNVSLTERDFDIKNPAYAFP